MCMQTMQLQSACQSGCHLVLGSRSVEQLTNDVSARVSIAHGRAGVALPVIGRAAIVDVIQMAHTGLQPQQNLNKVACCG